MKSTTKLVALTTETENELKVNDKVSGTLHRQGRRTYQFIQRTTGRTTLPEEVCHNLAQLPKQNGIIPGKIYANGYGVTVRLYVRHDKYNTPRELTTVILIEIKELCRQLLQVAAVELLNQIKQVWS